MLADPVFQYNGLVNFCMKHCTKQQDNELSVLGKIRVPGAESCRGNRNILTQCSHYYRAKYDKDQCTDDVTMHACHIKPELLWL